MAISKGKFEGLTRVSYKGEICTVKVYEKGICETEDGHLLKLGQAQYERFLEAQKKIQEQAREEEQRKQEEQKKQKKQKKLPKTKGTSGAKTQTTTAISVLHP